MELGENLYYSLIGELIEPIKGVDNAFADGEPCARLYHEVQEAYQSLRERLDVEDEDEDVETIIDSLLMIQKHLCLEMFKLGCKYGQKS